jgi:hypothetical protein
MTYSIHGDVYRVMRITGPAHNLLGLSFSHAAPEYVTVEKLGGTSEQAIDEDRLKRAVLSGVAAANAAQGSDYHVARIQYVSTDTPDPEIYSLLARQIVERLASGGPYDDVAASPKPRAPAVSVRDGDL